jgi:hypothetical protein
VPAGPASASVSTTYDLVKARVGPSEAKLVRLASGVEQFSRPQWSPDGQRILVQTGEGLTLVTPEGTQARSISDAFWLSYAWASDDTIYGLQATNVQQLMLVALDLRSGRERVVNPNLGLVPRANQPIRGFSRVQSRGFVTSVARVRSDIWLLDDFLPAPTLWERLRPWSGTP